MVIDLSHLSTATALALILSVFIPLVSALTERFKIPQPWTGVVTVVLAAVNGFFTEWANSSGPTHYDWKTAAGIALGSLLLAMVGHVVAWAGQHEASVAGRRHVAGDHEAI